MDTPELTPSAVLQRDMETIASLAAARLPGLRSLLLGGSFARGEGTFLRRGTQWVPYKDYDLFAVMDGGTARQCEAALAGVRQAAYRALGYAPYDERRPSPGQFHIGIALVPIAALGRLPHDLSNAELGLLGKVVWGEDVKAKIRSDPRLIPPSSGLRPVLNKLIGLVEQWGDWIDDGTTPDDELGLAVAYDRAKTVLDVAAAVLLLHGVWTAGYAARNSVLREHETDGPLVPAIGPLAVRADEALAFKLQPVAPDPRSCAQLWREARDGLLAVVGPLAGAVLSYPTGDPLDGARRFARAARIAWLRPFAEQAATHYGLPLGHALAPCMVVCYSLVENARVGKLSALHPLIRAWSAAWAWLAATVPGADTELLQTWAGQVVGAPRSDPRTLRDSIVGLFKAVSTARRQKRTL